MENFFDLILVGPYEGLIWFPFVLGVGILYRYLKIIDISIEGVAVAAGIAAVASFNFTQNYLISFLASLTAALIFYSTVFILIRKLSVHPIMAGIIFTLIIHAAAAIVIGESLVLKGSALFSGVFSFSFLSLVVSLILIALTELFFRTQIGLKIRFAGKQENIDSSIPVSDSLIFLAFIVTAFIIATGSFLYVHKQGVARSGGGFEFLIVSLGSFLITDKLIEYSLKKLIFKSKTRYNRKIYLLVTLLRSPVLKALTGSLIFQTIAIFVIFYTPNPSWWKLLFALILLPGVGSLPAISSKHFKREFSPDLSGIRLENISFSYKTDYINKPVFKELNADFQKGIYIIWGDNGSGKSTLLKIINSSLEADSGNITMASSLKHYSSIFHLTQNPFDCLNIEMTVFDNLRISLAQKNLSITRINRLKHLLNSKLKEFRLGGITLEDEQMFYQLAGHLSGGQAQRVVLYKSVLFDPQVILADEPSGGMDQANFKGLLQVISNFEQKGKLIIMVTHDVRMKSIPAVHLKLSEGKLLPA